MTVNQSIWTLYQSYLHDGVIHNEAVVQLGLRFGNTKTVLNVVRRRQEAELKQKNNIRFECMVCGAHCISRNKNITVCPKHLRMVGRLSGRDRNRERVRARDKYTCTSCGKIWGFGMRRFDVHHLGGLCGKKSKGYDKQGELEHLVTLCHRCHFKHPEHSSVWG